MMQSKSYGKLLTSMPPGFEIGGRFFWQAKELLGEGFFLLGEEEYRRDAFMDTLLDTMLKCHAMEYHMGNFVMFETEFLAQVESGTQGYFRSHTLFFEVEAFLFQLKSALDVGIKLLGILIPNRFRVITFEGKGATLRRALEQYQKDASAKKDLAAHLSAMLQDDRDSWLEKAIDLRDQVSHYRTLGGFEYLGVNHDGQRSLKTPTILGVPPVDFLRTTYQNCIEFLQDFMCLSIGMALPSTFTIGVRSGPTRVGEPIAQYIKFGLGTLQQDAESKQP